MKKALSCLVVGTLLTSVVLVSLFASANAAGDEIEIAYDDGSAEGGWSMGPGEGTCSEDGGNWGYAIRMTTPDSEPFTISTIKVCSMRYGGDCKTRFEIWDHDKNILYLDIVPHSEYSILGPWDGDVWDYATWGYKDVPDVVVSGDFYIAMYTDSSDPEDEVYPDTGVYVCYDRSFSSDRSHTTQGKTLTWDLDTPQETTNWMIRAVGRTGSVEDTTPPELTITSPAPGTTTDSPTITVTGIATDESGIASVTVNGVLASGAADWSTWSAEVTLAAEGENTITAVATDGAGLTTTKTVTVTYSNPVEKYALIVGIGQYQYGDIYGLRDIKTAVPDAKAIRNLLVTGYDFIDDTTHTKMLLNEEATRKNIINNIGRLAGTADDNDRFVFYFAGHGSNDSSEEYLLPYDTYPYPDNELARFKISSEDIADKILLHRSTVALIFDSCNSGGMAKETDDLPPKTGVDGDNEILLMSCKASQNSSEPPTMSHALFTNYLLKAFTDKNWRGSYKADADKNGRVSLEEAFNYARPKVEWHWSQLLWLLNEQNPQMMDHYATAENPDEECYFSQDQINPTFITAEAGCPVHLHAYDSEGRHTGLNSAGDGIEENIPGSYYSGPEYDPEEIIIIGKSDNFRYKIEALNEGEFNFTLTQSTATKTTTVTYLNVQITNTTVATVNVSQENPTYTMEIDNDGDGTPDYTKEPNSIEIVELLPDLTLSSTDISFSPPPATQPTEGDSVTITATVRNIGEAAASDFRVSFFDGDSLIGIDTISVTAGFTTTASTTWIAVAGDRTIKVVADSEDAINESDETNNEATKTITVKEKAVVVSPVPSYRPRRGGGGGGGGSRDTDGDGVSDVDEILAETDWKDASDYPGKAKEEAAVTPTPTPSPALTLTPTVTPAQPTTPTAVATPTTTPTTPTPQKKVPGFEASLAVFGLLGVAYLLGRRRVHK
ncbi:MAG: hypothetical protein C4B55_01715 [Candidatus Methanophagaceae archaeon]|nr:MAG: hypothetical protein C4B55_01715 [Methanophagales archaeon]